MSKRNHSRARKSGGFEKHLAAKTARDAGGDPRRGRLWRCLVPFRTDGPPQSPHMRPTARVLALPGKHIRRVEEPAKSSHGKGDV